MSSKSEVEAEILIEEIEDLIVENPTSSDTIAENDAIVNQLLDLRIPLRNFKKLFKIENLNKELIQRYRNHPSKHQRLPEDST